MRSGGGTLFTPQRQAGRRALAFMTVAAVALFAIALPVAVGIAGSDHQTKKGPNGVDLTTAEAKGRILFSRNCAQCHTLKGAAAVGTVGPNLDVLRPPKALVLNAIAKGRAQGR